MTNQPLYLDQTATYQIKVRGQLDESWTDWFGGMTITYEGETHSVPITILTGAVADQAVLRGILNKIWNLKLMLISVARFEMDSEPEAVK